MKLVVLGGTGQTGQRLLQQALDGGHNVLALCRNPAKLELKHEQLQVAKADIMSVESLCPHFSGCDAVLSCLGSDGGIVRSTLFYSETIKSIIAAMREARVDRLVCMTSWFTNFRQNDNGPFFFEWILKPIMGVMIGRILADMARMEEYMLRECQDVDYTIVKPPGLSNGAVTDKTIKVQEGCQFVTGNKGTSMARADVARYMLSILGSTDVYKVMVAVSL